MLVSGGFRRVEEAEDVPNSMRRMSQLVGGGGGNKTEEDVPIRRRRRCQ